MICSHSSRFVPVVFMVAPVQLTLLNPVAFALIEWGAMHERRAASSSPHGGVGGFPSLLRVLCSVARSPQVFSVFTGLALKANKTGHFSDLHACLRACVAKTGAYQVPEVPGTRRVRPYGFARASTEE